MDLEHIGGDAPAVNRAVGLDRAESGSWFKTAVDITFRGMTTSPSVEAAIERWVARLRHVYDRIEYCAVVVDKPGRRHRHGARFHVRITLAIPDHTISVSHDPGREAAHTDVYVAVSDAFRAARRQLEDIAHDNGGRRRGMGTAVAAIV